MAGKPRTPQCVYNYSLVLSGGSVGELFNNATGRARFQVVGRLLLRAEARVYFRCAPYGLCGFEKVPLWQISFETYRLRPNRLKMSPLLQNYRS